MTSTENTQSPIEELLASSPRATRAAQNLVSIARLWTTQGLEMGRTVLESSSESLRLVAATLADVKSRVNGEPEPTPGDAPRA